LSPERASPHPQAVVYACTIIIVVQCAAVIFFFCLCIAYEFVKHLVMQYDTDGDGKLSWEEFNLMIDEKIGVNIFGRCTKWVFRALGSKVSYISRSLSVTLKRGMSSLR
jgi:hypothetical protein